MHPFLYTVNLPKLTFVLFQISRNFSASSSFMGPLVAQVVKNLPAMQETQVRSRGSGSSPEEGNSNPLQYFCLENSMDKGVWQATVCGVTKSQTQLSNSHFTSIHFSHSVVSDSLRPHESKHTRPPCPSPTPRVHSNSCPSGRWWHPAISSSVIPFSSCPQSLPASESFPTSQLFAWGGQRTGVSALASFLPKTSSSFKTEIILFHNHVNCSSLKRIHFVLKREIPFLKIISLHPYPSNVSLRFRN